jgi:hypothetical protein
VGSNFFILAARRNGSDRKLCTMHTKNKKSFKEIKSEARRGLVSEFAYFLAQNKKWWLLPVLIVIGLLGLLVVLSGSGAAPFIYTLF